MKKLVLHKYGHEYCNPCRVLKPILAEVVEHFKNDLDFVDFDTLSMSPDDISKVNLKAVPTLILFENKVEVWRYVGFISKDNLITEISKFI